MSRDNLRLSHILEAIKKIYEFSDSGVRDSKTEAAVMYEIAVIGEAVRALSEETKLLSTTIPWSAIVTMRNKLVHEYFRVNSERLWETVKQDIPVLQAEISALLSKLTEPDSQGR